MAATSYDSQYFYDPYLPLNYNADLYVYHKINNRDGIYVKFERLPAYKKKLFVTLLISIKVQRWYNNKYQDALS